MKRAAGVIFGLKNNLDKDLNIIGTGVVIGYDNNGILVSRIYQPKNIYKVVDLVLDGASGEKGCKGFDQNGNCQCWPKYIETNPFMCVKPSLNPNHQNCLEKNV